MLPLFFSQLTCIAAERSAEKRLDYIARISAYQPEQVVFVDESSVDRRMPYRGRAWSIRGTQAQRKAFFIRGIRYGLETCPFIVGADHLKIFCPPGHLAERWNTSL
jgi:hypothetical protein